VCYRGLSASWRLSSSCPVSGTWNTDRRVLCGSGIHGEETKRRASAMILSRVGPRGSPCRRRAQVGGGRQAPRGWRAGAPYRGTASPPPPPPPRADLSAQGARGSLYHTSIHLEICFSFALPCTAAVSASCTAISVDSSVRGSFCSQVALLSALQSRLLPLLLLLCSRHCYCLQEALPFVLMIAHVGRYCSECTGSRNGLPHCCHQYRCQ